MNLLVENEQMRFLLALLSILALGIFLGILVYKVPRLDLGLISLIAFLMCVYDFYLSIKTNEAHQKNFSPNEWVVELGSLSLA